MFKASFLLQKSRTLTPDLQPWRGVTRLADRLYLKGIAIQLKESKVNGSSEEFPYKS